MIGSIKSIVSLVKKCNKNILTANRFLHREALVAKTNGSQIKKETIKTTTFFFII